MAAALGCQPTYLSQILHREAQLSLEQADALNTFLRHGEEEGFFFLLLVQLDRAGTPSLRQTLKKRIDEILLRRSQITHRLALKSQISLEEQSRYYSTWIYSAVHMALTIKQLQTPAQIADYFGIPQIKVRDVLAFLVNAGLAVPSGDRFLATRAQMSLDSASPLMSRHHANWRQRALQSLDNGNERDLHYSMVFSASSRDLERLKESVLRTLKEQREIIKGSNEEQVFAFSIDLFHL
jgi:uncharacterized protein (TIGR02147 family)